MIDVQVFGGAMSQAEIDHYIEYGVKKYSDKTIYALEIHLDGDYANLQFYFSPKFERVYRITDYPVKSLAVLNDAKQAEYHDRVFHSLEKINEEFE